MKRIFFALMVVATIAMVGSVVGCKPKNEPNPEEPDPVENKFVLQDTDVVFQVNWN